MTGYLIDIDAESGSSSSEIRDDDAQLDGKEDQDTIDDSET